MKEKNEEVKKLEQIKEKEKLILAYKKLQKKEEKLREDIKESKPKLKLKTKRKPKLKKKRKPKIKNL